MLNKLILKNFKAHKKLIIKFDPKITSIVGTNYKGKSTIIRALRWIALNKPTGNSVINWDAKKAIVKLFFDNHQITRIKSKTKNLYKLDDKNYTAFKNNVPSDIAKTLNISNINFQKQHDLPFWFNETPGEVSRQLNAIVNLDIIDHTLTNIDQKKRKNNTEINIVKSRLLNALNNKKSLSYIKKQDADFKQIEQLNRDISVIKNKKIILDDFIIKIKSYLDIINKTRNIKTEGEQFLAKIDNIIELNNLINKLRQFIKSINQTKKLINKKIPSIQLLDNLFIKLKNITDEASKINNIINIIKKQQSYIQGIKAKFIKAKTKLDKDGKICPLCGKQR